MKYNELYKMFNEQLRMSIKEKKLNRPGCVNELNWTIWIFTIKINQWSVVSFKSIFKLEIDNIKGPIRLHIRKPKQTIASKKKMLL